MSNRIFSMILLCLWIIGFYLLLSITDSFEVGYEILKFGFKIIGIPVIIFCYQSFIPFISKTSNLINYNLTKAFPLMLVIGAMIGSLVDHIPVGVTIALSTYLIWGLCKIGKKLFYK